MLLLSFWFARRKNLRLAACRVVVLLVARLCPSRFVWRRRGLWRHARRTSRILTASLDSSSAAEAIHRRHHRYKERDRGSGQEVKCQGHWVRKRENHAEIFIANLLDLCGTIPSLVLANISTVKCILFEILAPPLLYNLECVSAVCACWRFITVFPLSEFELILFICLKANKCQQPCTYCN